MMKLKFLLVGAAVVTSFPASASTATSATASVFEAGRCMVQHDRRAAIALVQRLPLDNSVADLTALNGSAARDCAAGATGASAMMVRGAIAQALFQRDFRGSMSNEPRGTIQLANLGFPETTGSGPGAAPTAYRWADCVVRNDPAATEALLRTDIGSPGEAAAVSQLQPYMAACMAQGAQISVRQSEMRSLFAQGAYHNGYRYWTGQLRSTR